MAARYKEDLFEQTGQYEPITTRIRNILREYKDGVEIFKELIQNADDAGATTVKFLVDWRKGQTGSLFSPGMAECQGPALWAYNNAVFTDKDFENINKLAGETKVEDISKIGRFGLGFNAVYHLTDVPSFISREHLVVFDPNIHHLERHIKDRSRPGIRINLSTKPELFTHYHDQFQPYNGVFGCNTVQRRGGFYYDGTLFRFPFRTASQARTSDISRTAYGPDRIKTIISSLCECASTLLIFSQHVKEVEVYELNGSRQPEKMQLVLSVKKVVNSKTPFIEQCSKWWERYRESQIPCTEYPSGCEYVTIVTKKEPSELSGCRRGYNSVLTWLVVSTSGTDASLAIARSPEGRARGFLPCGGVAFVVHRASSQGSYESNVASHFSGELFCFLPLSIPTGLPVHVNGYFAIMSNRVEIWKRTILRTQPIEVEWNEALMEDALARAYITLLESMKELIGNVQHYQFNTLWPSIDAVDMRSWEKLVQKICSVLLDPKSKLFYSDGIWLSITDGFLLSDDFNEIYDTAVEVLRSLRIHVLNLPRNILQTLIKFDPQGILQRRTLTFTEFVKQYFFPNIKTLIPNQRDAIVCFGLDRILKGRQSLLPSSVEESSLFKQNACISVSENGEVLAKPCELIDPFSPAAKLFSEQDHRFPVGNGLCSANLLYALETLGMVKDLDWTGVLERAQSIASSDFPPQAERSRKFIEYLNKQIDHLPKPACYRNLLQRVTFLPVLKEPADEYPLPWKGSNLPLQHFCAPNELFLPKDAKLIGSSCYILNTSDESGCGKPNTKVKILFGFSSRLPEDKLVIRQLDEAIKFWKKLSEEKHDTRKRFAIESVCQKIYEFFNDSILEKAKNRSSLYELGKRHWLFLQGKFVQSKKVAYTSNGSGAPFLFTLPSNYKRDYRHLFEAMQIKHTFDVEDYINALYELEGTKKGSVLTKSELQLAISFITQIDVQNPVVKDYIGNIPLPDTYSILRRSQDVVVNLSLWLGDYDDNLKVHEKIPPQTAHTLGARSLKSVILKKCSHSVGYGESFGQHEELTDRLKGILDGYPTEGILKELVQNADDAHASEIHFIHDTRSLGCEKVLTNEVSDEIQGPALCVYNDKPFSKKDLDGIKKLGIGSKRDSPEMTGKYGIGFNSVYHLTDCPSFLSNNDALVFLDPHCRYFMYDDRGRLFKLKSLDKEFRNNMSDTLDGYLPDYFNLQGSTMFRFPLRRIKNESKISNISPNMEKLLMTFQEEARKSLLFLNHVKKITLSKIHPNNKLEEIYRVETVITPDGEKKRQEIERTICEHSDTPTAEIQWKRASYTVTVKENKKEVEEWLIQKCIGSVTATLSTSDGEQDKIPDGRKLGLLPRGGLAARLWTHSRHLGEQKALRGIVYCFLPLPENYTNLPVHVNGHFALDSTRRRLWTDTDGTGPKSKWNHFMNSCVIPPAYAALIKEARNHLCNDKDDNIHSRYYALFPNVVSDSPWKTLITELYRYLGQTRANVLPLLVPTSENKATTNFLEKRPKTDIPEAPQSELVTFTQWLSADQTYFVISGLEDDFLHLLVRIGLPVLLHAPSRIHSGFRSAGITLHEVSPKSIIDFLREFESRRSSCKIANLPERLKTTVVKTISELTALIEYCCEDEDFGNQLEGLPLLVTQDGYLRVFDPRQPVFLSEFGGLFPTQSHLFVDFRIVRKIPWIATKSEENIVFEFTVQNLARLLPEVFTDKVLRAIENNATWKFPCEGILSEQWFEQFWDFLQNFAQPVPNEDFVTLECLSNWPVIPTTCGKLVTIKNAKSVLDMTTTGTESTAQVNVRTFLSDLECPVLNKKITFKDEHSLFASGAVTDSYVAHPHSVKDVLVVLHHMLKTNKLDLSKVYEDAIHDFLRFVQDNYERSGALELCKQIVKDLPFHKTMSGQFVSLIDQYYSYALIPSWVPTQQLDELQERAKCTFLNSDALPALEKLYKDLDVRAGQNVAQFYTEFVFRHFSMFTRESQMKHLIYIRDEVYPSLPRGIAIEKDIFLKSMAQTPCIPDQDGHLHKASDFLHPNNEVFKVLYEGDNNKFPPSPFNKKDWSGLLKDIGLRVDITPQLFLQFCTTVAEDGRYFERNSQSHKESEVLVKYLFSKKSLKGEKCLSQVSQIKFIAPARVEEQLTSIYDQYRCSKNGYPPFMKFSNAVPWRFRFITWTTAPILPIWAQPNNMDEFESLHIACSGPTYTDVLDHLTNVVTCNPDTVDSVYLHKIITKPIYQFLWEAMQCSDGSPNNGCSDICMDIGIRLENVACIFLQEDKTFVRAEQLVFRLSENSPLKPFLYPVPREFGELEHFLKRLGATEKPTPLQIAYVLNSIHNEVEDVVLSTEMEEKVMYAMRVLFGLLCKSESADEIDQLYLPSQDKHLVKSYEMVCNVSSRNTDFTGRLQRPMLLRFEECGLKGAADDYIDALPEHLRPVKFDELVREEVDSECKVSVCPKARHDSICTFQEQFENLLRSDEFQVGLKRLLVEDRQDPQKFEQRIKKLQTDVKTKCTGYENIKIHVIYRSTEEVIANFEESCYAVQEEDTWSLYMQHIFRDDKILVLAATCVNKILGDCIQKEKGLIAMLNCSSPSEIASVLNKLNITQSISKTDDDSTDLDDELMEWDSGEEPVRRARDGFDGAGGGSHGTIRGKSGDASFNDHGYSVGASFIDGGYGVGYRGGGGCSGSGGHSRIKDEVEDERFYPKNRKEANRWLQQSKSDLESARWLLRSGPPFSAHACFQSHQVVEKCLKAMLFYGCGISGGLLGSHEVLELASKLREEIRIPEEKDMQSVRRVAKYYLSTRYPNRQPFNVVPAEAFSKNEAEMAVDAASKVMELVGKYCLEAQ